MTVARSYYDTTAATPADRARYESAASSQERRIEEHLRAHPDLAATPSELARLFSSATPLTSVRRAVTNLTARGVLEKTTQQRKGLYGRAESAWRLRRGEMTQGEMW